ncbi:nucleoside triphosphate pyrophosphohydrolase [Neptuniibacter sp. CAU 1671]|uniref:nucleoside triphosphate pyrophosphohydrolase n=1 Tax=Neptuniibacter sp. CAU 1671 TaxID=3032593 RepID=UPI0023D9F1C5|nr:nucleoside triphosphate pyrophosphohydrolase [Neptuniibacter sp. CAU 1671]MDF2182280.1 nucleoside triphosphate pyrophosphohydrolase [Neptuniibacter sp. CAU 1671]
MSQTVDSKQFSLNDLLTLMARLRDPETGCPWDLKQDFASIVPHTLEEAYEVADAIDQADWAHVKDELGDLLFQVIFYARLGEEAGHFDFNGIVGNLIEKLLRRHPHVFPEGTLESRRDPSVAPDEADIARRWDEIKAFEKQLKPAKTYSYLLDAVPNRLPALNRACKLQKQASTVGFDWDETHQVLDQIEEELQEVREALASGDQQAVAEEMGDLLFAQVNLARKLGVNPEMAVRATNQKFTRRFNYIEDQVKASGKTWQSFSLAELDHWWREAKQQGL